MKQKKIDKVLTIFDEVKKMFLSIFFLIWRNFVKNLMKYWKKKFCPIFLKIWRNF